MSHHAAQKYAAMLATLLLTSQAFAADPTPELKQRPPGTAQAIGAVHTLRQIPEACARLEGVFTGNAAQPYTLSVVRSSPTCQPRARFVDFAKAAPSVASGWIFNDVIRVPSAAVPVAASGRARVAQAGGRETAARWPGPITYLSGRRQTTSCCRKDPAGADVRYTDDGGR